MLMFVGAGYYWYMDILLNKSELRKIASKFARRKTWEFHGISLFHEWEKMGNREAMSVCIFSYPFRTNKNLCLIEFLIFLGSCKIRSIHHLSVCLSFCLSICLSMYL